MNQQVLKIRNNQSYFCAFPAEILTTFIFLSVLRFEVISVIEIECEKLTIALKSLFDVTPSPFRCRNYSKHLVCNCCYHYDVLLISAL